MTDDDTDSPNNRPQEANPLLRSVSPTDEASIEIIVNSEYNALRLDKWLSEQIKALTRTRIKALIEGKALRKDGATFTDPSWRIRTGENYLLTIPAVSAPVPKAEAIPLDVYFEDADVIVVNKPAGLVVHPAAGNWSGTLVNALIGHCGTSLSGIGGVARPGIVHRLDKETSGLIVVAKNDRAHSRLTDAFASHTVERTYEAVCVGAPRPSLGTIDAAIGRLGGDRKKMAVVKPSAKQMRAQWEANDFAESESIDPERRTPERGAKHAVTHYKIINTFGRTRAKLAGDAIASHIECRLETGRTHQIRVHMSHIGHPLVGDPVYGRGPGLSGLKPDDAEAQRALKILGKFKRQALHAQSLGFEHPITGEYLSFSAAPPKDFKALTQALEAL
ncbi:MAG: pseudouridine synthase [Pseudomonadota bacterium]